MTGTEVRDLIAAVADTAGPAAAPNQTPTKQTDVKQSPTEKETTASPVLLIPCCHLTAEALIEAMAGSAMTATVISIGRIAVAVS
jgi:hypothetical protein